MQCRPLAPKPWNIFENCLQNRYGVGIIFEHIFKKKKIKGKEIFCHHWWSISHQHLPKNHLDSVVTEEVWRKRSSYSSGQALHVRTSSPRNLLERKIHFFLFHLVFWNSPSKYLHPCQAPILLLDIWARLVSQFRRGHLPQKWLLWSIKH